MHTYQPSQLDLTKCRICKREEIEHTDRATCEVCGNSGNMELWIDILMCPDCYEKETAAQVKHESESDARALLAQSAQIEIDLQVKEDIFNSPMISIAQLKEAIDNDATITNKYFTLAQSIDARFKRLTKVLLPVVNAKQKELQKEVFDLQIFYNELAKKLRVEERAKISLQDVNYKPAEPKISKPKAPSIKKYDKTAIRNASAESKIPEATIQMICVARQVTPVEAVRILREAGL